MRFPFQLLGAAVVPAVLSCASAQHALVWISSGDINAIIFTVVGTDAAVRAAVERPVQRASGLRERLWP